MALIIPIMVPCMISNNIRNNLRMRVPGWIGVTLVMMVVMVNFLG